MTYAPLVCYYKKRRFENYQDSRSCSLCKLNGWVSLSISNEFPMYREGTKKKVNILMLRTIFSL